MEKENIVIISITEMPFPSFYFRTCFYLKSFQSSHAVKLYYLFWFCFDEVQIAFLLSKIISKDYIGTMYVYVVMKNILHNSMERCFIFFITKDMIIYKSYVSTI
jgi:hypothetical protein